MFTTAQLYDLSLDLLRQLITTPSFSKEEDKTAAILENFFKKHSIATQRAGNNVWAMNQYFDSTKPTILLNSHHDTVKPNSAYTRDPFMPLIEDGKLYGLGSNDAGGPLVSLIATFLHFFDQQDLKYNFVFAASAEEEISGVNGIEKLWPSLPKIDFAIVGEPTLTDVAVAEKGLLVIDCVSHGKAGHAAREEGENAIYNSLKDIEWFRTYQFPKTSSALGKVKMSVTVINAGQAHNQVPPESRFTVDIRVTDAYTLEEVLAIVKENVSSAVTGQVIATAVFRNTPGPSAGGRCKKLGKKIVRLSHHFGPGAHTGSFYKDGPGDSARSHSADEFIYIKEIEEGIEAYIELIENL